MRLVATPAGLLDVAPSAGQPDLTLTVTEESPWELAQAALRGDKPAVRIAGDVQFAQRSTGWWNTCAGTSRKTCRALVGDAPAHAIGDVGRQMVAALRKFAAPAPAPAPTPAPSASNGPGQAGA